MDLPGSTGSTDEQPEFGSLPRPDEWTVFVARVFDGGDWVRIGLAQREARAACQLAAEDMRLMRTGMPAWEVQARAMCAGHLLAEGITGTAMLDEQHRVDRIDLLPPGRTSPVLATVSAERGRSPPLLLDGAGERLPRLSGDPQYWPGPVVLGVAHGDQATVAGDLDALPALPAAVR